MSNKIKRILLKLSGEALLGNQQFGVDPKVLIYLAKEIRSITEKGIYVRGDNKSYSSPIYKALHQKKSIIGTVIFKLPSKFTFF